MVRSSGFSLVEVLVALLIFAVGALGLAAETAALARQVARARRAAWASAAAAGRLERLQSGACDTRADGSELVWQGGSAIAVLRWVWSATAASSYRVRVVTVPAPLATGPAVPAETLRAVISCER